MRVPCLSRSYNTLSSGRTPPPPVARRAMLYVPGSNPRMLAKSLVSESDSIAYDLEDSVAPVMKSKARRMVAELLDNQKRERGEMIARINAVGTGFETEDLEEILRTRNVMGIALPKTDHPDHIEWVVSMIQKLSPPHRQRDGPEPMRIIAMIESSVALRNIHQIAEGGKGHLDALLFAAEDFCADVGITRTQSGSELLYARSKMVIAAKARGLQAIDMVCVDYKNQDVLRDECEDGRRMGFEGKQAIHPAQIETIHESFAPSDDIVRSAARVVFSFQLNDKAGKGAYSLDGKMIDAPVYKQALKVLAKAQAAQIAIPTITKDDIRP